MNTSIDTLRLDALADLLEDAGQPHFRLEQIIEGLYRRDASSYDDMTNIPKSLRTFLSERSPLLLPTVKERAVSRDGTRKYLIEFADGACVETVAIPARSSKERLTVCFSTQVGCPMGCAFCATGHEGFFRNLGPGEMVRQIMLAQQDMGRRVTNVVAMGQGEPFLNYDSVRDALQIINSSHGLSIGARKITVSTCGIIPGIRRFSQETEQYTLALSLHSAIQETRDQIMPRTASYPLKAIKQALRSYCDKKNRRVTLEYLLIKDFNDDSEHKTALLSFCRGIDCHINVIPLNLVAGSSFQPSSRRTANQWVSWFTDHGIEVSLRASRGSDIEGACGQLKRVRS